MKKRKWLSLLLAVMMLVSAVPFFPVTADAADGTVEVSTWAELKKALDYTTNCSVVKVVKDIETKSLNGHTGLHQDNIIFMTMAMDKVLDLNGHTVNAYAKYYSEVAQGYLINISHKDARLTIRDSVGGGALIGEFNQEFYFQFIKVSGGTLVMESGTVKMLCPSKDDQYTKCAISVSGTAVFNGGEVLTQVTSPGGEREERYLSRRLQAIRGEAGGSVTINGGTLHVAPETYEGKNNAYGQYFDEEYRDLVNGHCGYTLMAANSCKVSINGGTFQGPVRLDAGGMTTSDGPGDGPKPLAEINGGTFLEYVQAWVAASFENSFSTSEVVINGGEFSKKFWLRPKFVDKNDKDLTGYHVAAKLNGGTFHETLSVDKQSSDYGHAPVRPRLSYSDVTFLADEMLGKNAVQTGKGTFAALDTSSYREYIPYYDYNKTGRWSEGFVFEIKAVNNQPTKILSNAWGMKSVTLDGNPIDYFKDWKGTVERMDNSTAHTLKFEWYPLAQELKDAGYSYRAECDRYISGNKTPTTDTISTTDTEYSFTIPAGADPKVYSFDLHLNLQKNGSNIGIFSNEHIVKLVVNEAPPEPPAPVAHRITITNEAGTATPATAIAGEIVTVTAKDLTSKNMMFTRWYCSALEYPP